MALTLMVASIGLLLPSHALAYNFGDFRSSTLVGKAWAALGEDDIEAVLAYTNKCLELYGGEARKMQADREAEGGYVQGSDDAVHEQWALNDVATGLFIQGEAYRKAGMMDEAKEVYQKIVKEYTYGQTWDPKGWFWKPADAAKEKLAMIESGSNIDFGDYTSSFLTTQAWQALNADDIESVRIYTDKVMDLYAKKAKEMQDSMAEYAWGSNPEEEKKNIFAKWALNDVGTSLFIKGEAYKKSGRAKEAKQAYKALIDDYYYAQCWDPKGWFWKPAEAAQQALDELGEI